MLSSISVSNMLCWSTCGYHLCVGEHREDNFFENLQEAAVADKTALQSVLSKTRLLISTI